MPTDQLNQTVAAFLRHLREDLHRAPNTVSAYQNDLGQFVSFVDGHNQRAAFQAAATDELVAPEAVSAFVFALRERGYSPATIARRIAAVKSFFGYAQATGRIAMNPASALDSPRVTRPDRKAVSASDLQVLLDDAEGEAPEALRNRAMLLLLYQTGLRVSEVVGLNVADFDQVNGTMRARGRTGRQREVTLPSGARSAMELYVEKGRSLLRRGNEEEALFLNGRGGRLTRQGFWLIITTRARRSGVNTPVSPHALRNTFARERLEDGTALSDLKELLGHVSISTTRALARASGGRRPQPA
jgi:integrase/recombinase XerD